MNQKRRKMVGTIIGVSILTLLVIGVLFMALNPEFGGEPNASQISRFHKSENYWDGKFHSPNDRHFQMTFQKLKSIQKAYKNSNLNTEPNNIDVEKIKPKDLKNLSKGTQVIWFGHSSLLIQTEGVKLLLDPMFSQRPSPVPGFGAKRFSKELPIEVKELPNIDAVIISHDHYDHLDYETILQLKDKVDNFFTPLGVGAHLVRWGINESRITELDWDEEVEINSLRLICTPAQHYSSRGKWLSDKAKYLWCSWIIESESSKLFFSGDSGFNTHFKAIGEKYGPFDLAMMECGQYNANWPENHMTPEESAQASADLRTKAILPIHWGQFSLAIHDWLDPIRRINTSANKLKIPIISPKIGAIVDLKQLNKVDNNWWKHYDNNSKIPSK